MIFGHGIQQGGNALRAAPVGFVDEQKSVLPDGLLGGLLQLVGANGGGVRDLDGITAAEKISAAQGTAEQFSQLGLAGAGGANQGNMLHPADIRTSALYTEALAVIEIFFQDLQTGRLQAGKTLKFFADGVHGDSVELFGPFAEILPPDGMAVTLGGAGDELALDELFLDETCISEMGIPGLIDILHQGADRGIGQGGVERVTSFGQSRIKNLVQDIRRIVRNGENILLGNAALQAGIHLEETLNAVCAFSFGRRITRENKQDMAGVVGHKINNGVDCFLIEDIAAAAVAAVVTAKGVGFVDVQNAAFGFFDYLAYFDGRAADHIADEVAGLGRYGR